MRGVERVSRALVLIAGLCAGPLLAQDFPVEQAPTPRAPSTDTTRPARPSNRPQRNAVKTIEPTPEALDMGPLGPIEFVGPPDPTPAELEAAQFGIAAGEARPREGDPWGEMSLLDQTVAVGERRELSWKVGESFDGSSISTPVLVVHGMQPGPRLCLTAAVHGDELNGIEVVRRVANDINPAELNGTLVGLPIVNLLGFSRGSRYLPDRRDLNRYFPGTSNGSAASRIAASLFRKIIVHCDALVDFHTGSFDRANLPQVRGDLTIPSVLEFTRGFGATPVLHSPGTRGMLRLGATDRGIPAVTFEVGAPLRLEPELIDFATQAINTLMHRMGMTRSFRMWAEPQATFYESKWVRADHGGMLFATVRLGDRVRQGQRLGKVIDPVQNEEHELLSPFRGRVIGMALNQVVLPGFAAFHIGIETTDEAAAEEAAQPDPDPLERLEGDEMGPPAEDPADRPSEEFDLSPERASEDAGSE